MGDGGNSLWKRNSRGTTLFQPSLTLAGQALKGASSKCPTFLAGVSASEQHSPTHLTPPSLLGPKHLTLLPGRWRVDHTFLTFLAHPHTKSSGLVGATSKCSISLTQSHGGTPLPIGPARHTQLNSSSIFLPGRQRVDTSPPPFTLPQLKWPDACRNQV